MSLYDYGLGTLAQYELTADRSARTRGALLCYTAGAFAETSGKWYKFRLFSAE